MPHDASRDRTNKKPARKRRDGEVFHVSADEAGRTLLTALRGWFPEQSWASLKKLITGRRVQIHGNLCLDAGRKLKAGDVVKVLPHPQTPVPQPSDVVIRYIDKHLVVVEKPAGMTSVRHREERRWPARRKQLQPTLDEALPVAIERYFAEAKSGKPRKNAKKPSPPAKLPAVRPVHRLDRETSGVMVFARTPAVETKLVEMFREHDLTRVYRAVIWGEIDERTIETHLVLDRGDGRRGSTAEADAGQRAITHVKPIETIGDYSIVECRLETGRTHQIRIHLSELGHPICGDRMYRSPPGSPAIPDRSTAPRVALHAAKLEFSHPVTGERLAFESDWPTDLSGFLERLRADGR